jgi:FdhE protein
VTADTTNKIIKILQKQEKEEGKLPLLLEFYRSLLKTQGKARKSTGILEPTISVEAIKSRLSNGQPLVKFDELALDWPLLRQLFVEVIAVFAKYPQLFGEIPTKLTKPGAGRLLTKKAVKAWFTGKTLPPSLLEDISENLIQTIIQSTLQPFLAGHAEALIDTVKQDIWHRSYCPICGGIPDIAYLEKEVGARWLVCSRCDSEWRFHRMECPYCRSKDQPSISFLSDEQNLYRLYLCENCRCYLKVIDLRKTDAELLMPLERIYTLDLDKQARERGFHSYQAEAKR